MTEYAAERIREEDLKRRRKEGSVKEENQSEEARGSGEGQAASSSSGLRKRERDPEDALEQGDVIEEEQADRGVKRGSEEEGREEARRRKLEVEHGIKRSAEDEGETPESTRLRIEMM